MSKSQIIRIQSPDGTKRVELNRDTMQSLYQKVFKDFDVDPSRANDWALFKDRERTKPLPNKKVTTADYVKHGDMIFLLPVKAGMTSASMHVTDEEMTNGDESGNKLTLEEDDVDVTLSKQDGRVERKRDEQLCHHGPQGKCMNCIPYEPYDLEYLSSRTPPIKYMSFHAYIRKLQSGVDKGKYINLETLNCKIKPGCKEHPAWPKGICNKCQPPTVYLNRQPYRHVDNIMFENPQIVERFLNYWRQSGHQRIGFLYGRYEPYDGVPLGIKAVVSAIYEPPQETTDCTVELKLPDPNEHKINRLCKRLDLQRIGWIFTDLVNDEQQTGKVKHFRGNAESHYLSAEECIMAGYFQNIHKNPTKYSREGYFGSKFVTVVVTGDSTNQIHFEGYQVSNQCVSLVRDGCIIPTYDAPELAYIKESSNEQYIPDVYFREKDNYNNEVTKIARPLPVEYLIVDLPVGFPLDPIFRFNENSPYVKNNFPIENRAIVGEIQDFKALRSYMNQFPKYRFLDAMSDLHLLIFLLTNETLQFDDSIDTLLDAINTHNHEQANLWSQTPQWLTFEQFFVEHNEEATSYAQEVATWECSRCTFHNQSGNKECAICQAPRGR